MAEGTRGQEANSVLHQLRHRTTRRDEQTLILLVQVLLGLCCLGCLG